MNKASYFAFLLAFSAAFSQEVIRFQTDMDSSGAAIPVDTASFETYSRRIAIVQDSIAAELIAIEAVKKNTEAIMPAIEPKGEFETTPDYEARKVSWHKEFNERTEQDIKLHYARLAELEKAKAKIEENRASLYGSADYNFLVPGAVAFLVAPRAKLKISTVLEEKSIFSTENEIDFAKILSKDATVEVYKSRIKTVEARKAQVDGEINKMLGQEEGSKAAELRKKHEIYKQKLERSVAVLDDYIIAAQSAIVDEAYLGAKITLGAYDADNMQFELVAHDSSSKKSPFYFKGKVTVPIDTAKIINRAAPGLAANLRYINFPFERKAGSVSLAMYNLSLSRNGLEFKVDGYFSEIVRYNTIRQSKNFLSCRVLK